MGVTLRRSWHDACRACFWASDLQSFCKFKKSDFGMVESEISPSINYMDLQRKDILSSVEGDSIRGARILCHGVVASSINRADPVLQELSKSPAEKYEFLYGRRFSYLPATSLYSRFLTTRLAYLSKPLAGYDF